MFNMATTLIVSWNVWGVHDPLKRTDKLLSKEISSVHNRPTGNSPYKGYSGIFAWVGKAYHSTHSGYSRRVIMLIHKSLAYQEIDSVVDPMGQYVFLCCRLFTLNVIITFVYIPLHFLERYYSSFCPTWLTSLKYPPWSWETLTVTWIPGWIGTLWSSLP